jgi:hypothetical protein
MTQSAQYRSAQSERHNVDIALAGQPNDGSSSIVADVAELSLSFDGVQVGRKIITDRNLSSLQKGMTSTSNGTETCCERRKPAPIGAVTLPCHDGSRHDLNDRSDRDSAESSALSEALSGWHCREMKTVSDDRVQRVDAGNDLPTFSKLSGSTVAVRKEDYRMPREAYENEPITFSGESYLQRGLFEGPIQYKSRHPSVRTQERAPRIQRSADAFTAVNCPPDVLTSFSSSDAPCPKRRDTERGKTRAERPRASAHLRERTAQWSSLNAVVKREMSSFGEPTQGVCPSRGPDHRVGSARFDVGLAGVIGSRVSGLNCSDDKTCGEDIWIPASNRMRFNEGRVPLNSLMRIKSLESRSTHAQYSGRRYEAGKLVLIESAEQIQSRGWATDRSSREVSFLCQFGNGYVAPTTRHHAIGTRNLSERFTSLSDQCQWGRLDRARDCLIDKSRLSRGTGIEYANGSIGVRRSDGPESSHQDPCGDPRRRYDGVLRRSISADSGCTGYSRGKNTLQLQSVQRLEQTGSRGVTKRRLSFDSHSGIDPCEARHRLRCSSDLLEGVHRQVELTDGEVHRSRRALAEQRPRVVMVEPVQIGPFGYPHVGIEQFGKGDSTNRIFKTRLGQLCEQIRSLSVSFRTGWSHVSGELRYRFIDEFRHAQPHLSSGDANRCAV